MKKSEQLSRLINQAEFFISKKIITASSPQFVAWKTQIERYLANRFGMDSVEYITAHNRKYYPQVFIEDDSTSTKKALYEGIETTKIELRQYWAEECEKENDEKNNKKNTVPMDYQNVFIVHGHDGEMKEATARLLSDQGINGIILNEQPNRGKTVIEKIEEYSNVGAAIVLMTSDDIGRAKEESEDKFRARQNVVFEAGYFMGKYDRSRVVLVADKEIEMPSDLAGVIYTDGKTWKYEVCNELKAMGFEIDLNKIH